MFLQQTMKFEEAAINSIVESHYGTSAVVCPLCLRGQLHLNKGVLFCSCGLRLDTKVGLSPFLLSVPFLFPPFSLSLPLS